MPSKCLDVGGWKAPGRGREREQSSTRHSAATRGRGAPAHPRVLRPIFLAPLLGQSSSEGPAACPHGRTGPGGRGCPPTHPPFPLQSTHAPQPHTEHLLAHQGGNGGTQPAQVPPGCAPRVESHQAHPEPHTLARSHARPHRHAHAACHVCAQPRCYTRACRVPRVSGVTRAVCNVSDVLAAICACVCVTTCVHAPISHVCAHKLPHECLQCHTHTISPHARVETLGDPTGPHSGAGRAPRARGGTGGSAAAWPRG